MEPSEAIIPDHCLQNALIDVEKIRDDEKYKAYILCFLYRNDLNGLAEWINNEINHTYLATVYTDPSLFFKMAQNLLYGYHDAISTNNPKDHAVALETLWTLGTPLIRHGQLLRNDKTLPSIYEMHNTLLMLFAKFSKDDSYFKLGAPFSYLRLLIPIQRQREVFQPLFESLTHQLEPTSYEFHLLQTMKKILKKGPYLLNLWVEKKLASYSSILIRSDKNEDYIQDKKQFTNNILCFMNAFKKCRYIYPYNANTLEEIYETIFITRIMNLCNTDEVQSNSTLVEIIESNLLDTLYKWDNLKGFSTVDEKKRCIRDKYYIPPAKEIYLKQLVARIESNQKLLRTFIALPADPSSYHQTQYSS